VLVNVGVAVGVAETICVAVLVGSVADGSDVGVCVRGVSVGTGLVVDVTEGCASEGVTSASGTCAESLLRRVLGWLTYGTPGRIACVVWLDDIVRDVVVSVVAATVR
jgi:hypothetical protein